MAEESLRREEPVCKAAREAVQAYCDEGYAADGHEIAFGKRNKTRIFPFALLCLGAILLCLGACSSTKAAKPASVAAPSDTTHAAARMPVLVPEEEMLFSEVAEFVNLGQESIKDSLWFQAGADFDSALVRLSGLEATDSLSPNVYSMVKVYRDSVQKLLIVTVAKTSLMAEPAPLTQQFDEDMEEVSDSSVKVLDSITHHIDAKAYDLPLTEPLDNRILQAISVFMGPGKGYFSKWLNRKSRYEDIIRKKLDEREMPHDLMYLAMVESGFNPKAWSKASASGMWQFISGTGRRYGLLDDWWYDPRRDPLLATDAALDYLDDLHEEFGDWHQAMAAYNCGEGRIRKYREKDSTMSYWKMPLPQETRFYVPKILAAMIIGHNPERYGFTLDHPEAPLAFDTATVHHCLSIGTIAKAAGTSEDSIISLNPALRRWCTPPNKADYMVHIPLGTRELFMKNYELLDKTQLVNWHHHVVGKGDNLSSIASRYRVSVAAIKATNKIKGNHLHRGQSLLIPLPPGDSQKYAEADVPEAPAHSKYQKGSYKVKHGDNLFDISRRFNLTVSQLMAANHLRAGSTLRPGQRLKLGSKSAGYADDEPEIHEEPVAKVDMQPMSKSSDAPVSKSGRSSGGGRFQVYSVAANDNLFSISLKLSVSEDNLRKWNGIRGNRILPGQRLKYLSAKTSAGTDSEDADDPASEAAPSVARPSGSTPVATAGFVPAGAPTAVASTNISVEPSTTTSAKHAPAAAHLPTNAATAATAISHAPTAGRKFHLIKPGENLYQIARQYGTDFHSLMAMNGLEEGTEIYPGDSILVSGGMSKESAPAKEKSEEKEYYMVKPGDSLWDISVRYRTTVQKIKELNSRLPAGLKSGTRIRVR